MEEKDPYLYKVVTRVKRGNEVIDEIVQPLGIRKFEIIGGKGFYLNGEKYRCMECAGTGLVGNRIGFKE